MLAIPDLDEDSVFVRTLNALSEEQQTHLSEILEILTAALAPSDLPDFSPPTGGFR